MNSLTLTHAHKFVELLRLDLKVLHARLHKFHGFDDLFFKLLDLTSKLLFSLALSLAPILIALSVNKRVINFVDHKVEHSDWVGRNLTIENILVTSIREIHFLFVLGQVTHEPNCFLFDLLSISVGHQDPRIYNALLII